MEGGREERRKKKDGRRKKIINLSLATLVRNQDSEEINMLY